MTLSLLPPKSSGWSDVQQLGLPDPGPSDDGNDLPNDTRPKRCKLVGEPGCDHVGLHPPVPINFHFLLPSIPSFWGFILRERKLKLTLTRQLASRR